MDAIFDSGGASLSPQRVASLQNRRLMVGSLGHLASREDKLRRLNHRRRRRFPCVCDGSCRLSNHVPLTSLRLVLHASNRRHRRSAHSTSKSDLIIMFWALHKYPWSALQVVSQSCPVASRLPRRCPSCSQSSFALLTPWFSESHFECSDLPFR